MKKKYINYAALNAAEEYDHLKEVARTHRINKALAGKRCPDRDGVIKLLNQRRKDHDKERISK